MVDAVATQVLENGPVNLVLRFTNFSDGTGETNVTKFDATSATYAYKGIAPGIYARIKRLQYDVRNMGLRITYDANTDDDLFVLDENGDQRFDPPIGPPASAGATGSILFTTQGALNGSGYTVILSLRKGVPQL